MGDFNFDIDSSAKFLYGADRRSTRNLLKFTEAKCRWKAIAPEALPNPVASTRRAAPQNRPSHATHSHDAQQATITRGVIQGKHSNYRNFKISTAHPSPSSWVAYFERLDGRPMSWEGAVRSIVKTAPYSSQILAIADAQISIDDLMASEQAANPGA